MQHLFCLLVSLASLEIIWANSDLVKQGFKAQRISGIEAGKGIKILLMLKTTKQEVIDATDSDLFSQLLKHQKQPLKFLAFLCKFCIKEK